MRLGLQAAEVRRHGRTHLAPTTLELTAGRLVAVVGGDGAGKSTLLRVLVGAVAPTAGRVHAPARERLGYVSAAPGVYPDLSVAENLELAAAAYRVRGAARAERTRELLGATGLAAARARQAGQLSGGMRQKLAFACAMLHQPTLLVLDEPTTGLDPISRAELWRLVSSALAGGTTAVFATTYVDEAARADHVLVLDGGHPIAAGSPATIRAEMPGRVVGVEQAGAGLASWRRGRTRHAWVAPGAAAPAAATPIQPDLEDAVVVAALAAGAAGTAGPCGPAGEGP